MKIKEIKISIFEYDNIQQLIQEEQKLILMARQTSANAYSPYSKYNVGASILLENGEIICGNNQENAAFSSTLCAERVAMFYANANYPNTPIKTIAITSNNKNGLADYPAGPCGLCRQSLAESENRFNKPIRVILDGKKKIQIVQGIENLLPLMFKSESFL